MKTYLIISLIILYMVIGACVMALYIVLDIYDTNPDATESSSWVVFSFWPVALLVFFILKVIFPTIKSFFYKDILYPIAAYKIKKVIQSKNRLIDLADCWRDDVADIFCKTQDMCKKCPLYNYKYDNYSCRNWNNEKSRNYILENVCGFNKEDFEC